MVIIIHFTLKQNIITSSVIDWRTQRRKNKTKQNKMNDLGSLKPQYSCDKMYYKMHRGFNQSLTAAFWRDVSHTDTHTFPLHSGNIALVFSTQFYPIVWRPRMWFILKIALFGIKCLNINRLLLYSRGILKTLCLCVPVYVCVLTLSSLRTLLKFNQVVKYYT